VSPAVAAVLTQQGAGGDIVHVSGGRSRVAELAADLRTDGIRVNGIAPDAAAHAAPERVADAVYALVRGELAGTTGLVVPVEGDLGRGADQGSTST
jgi:hypothetical protein